MAWMISSALHDNASLSSQVVPIKLFLHHLLTPLSDVHKDMSLLLILIASLLSTGLTKLVNVTIDDTYGDPITGNQIVYSPSSAWQQGNGCGPCTAKPSPSSNAWMGTWHDATFNPNDTSVNNAIGQIINASVEFFGAAVYVNCILTRSASSPDGNTDLTFFLDDTEAGVFQMSPNGDTTYHFNSTVFSMTGISNSSHTLRMESGLAGQKAMILLDSIIYTVDDGEQDTGSSPSSVPDAATPSSADRLNKALVAGLVVVIVAIIGFVIGFVIYLKRDRKKRNQCVGFDVSGKITPFEQGISSAQHSRAVSPIASSYQGSEVSNKYT
ncbi:uncharacterized protein FOMMEDRAFT_166512 [Fomitiporia mediterranea MF3/22]|uniref:uncharacterized protein n=1 Tax=Fomitiporia mediterranea (strain MF3/22) TaxID=694068 RepID=UPI00044089C3|nr:uncharacterized protein FOMMEDRAFT_166512 [Fomitiporia mediterranea MF3/22]EJD06284.1 hypothetical protein FOMMEDRAFT_166512 [Fomitiporia mediterranea MF3/22]